MSVACSAITRRPKPENGFGRYDSPVRRQPGICRRSLSLAFTKDAATTPCDDRVRNESRNRSFRFVETEFAARSAVAGLERIRGNLSVARDAFENSRTVPKPMVRSPHSTPDFNSDFAPGPRQTQMKHATISRRFSGGREGICTPSNFIRRLGWRGASQCKRIGTRWKLP